MWFPNLIFSRYSVYFKTHILLPDWRLLFSSCIHYKRKKTKCYKQLQKIQLLNAKANVLLPHILWHQLWIVFHVNTDLYTIICGELLISISLYISKAKRELYQKLTIMTNCANTYDPIRQRNWHLHQISIPDCTLLLLLFCVWVKVLGELWVYSSHIGVEGASPRTELNLLHWGWKFQTQGS